MDTTTNADDHLESQVIIVGSGPAGYAAAIYAARANLAPVLLASSVEAGGELMNTTEVENYPGFPDGVMGPDLMEAMRAQAEKFGTAVVYDDVTALELTGPLKRATLGSGRVLEAPALIVATGSGYRKLHIPGEQRLTGHGVSWCATCDGAFFRNQHIAVIGGGDSAMEEALFLTRFADKVSLIHRRDSLRASKIMQDRARANPKIELVLNTEVDAIDGHTKAERLQLRDALTGQTRELEVSGVFIAIGHDPRTHLVHGQLDITPDGVIAVTGRTTHTNIPGVFAAGDVIDARYRQAITAAGTGATAALDAEHYLAALTERDNADMTHGGVPADEPVAA